VIPGIFFDINPAHRRNLFNSPCHHYVRLSFGPPMEDLDKGELAATLISHFVLLFFRLRSYYFVLLHTVLSVDTDISLGHRYRRHRSGDRYCKTRGHEEDGTQL
jgi:hypothetical protein